MGVDDDDRRPRRFSLCSLDGDIDQVEVVDIADVQHIPMPAAEARRHVIGERQRRAALDGDVVVVVEPDQV